MKLAGFDLFEYELPLTQPIVTKDETTIIEGSGAASAAQARIAQINKQIDAATSEYDKENLEKRRAALF